MYPVPEDFDFEKKYVFLNGSGDTLFQVIMVMPDHFNYVEANYLTLTYQLDRPIDEIVRQATQEEVEAGKRL
ncbi:hypothetical protein JZM36_15735 [Acinetobacter pittii]|uniref:hypothetical protein n=1 Tax=Acinetobacter pittii TaxID=48296 RepID=UPI00198244B1|nr:hypothetical protein [Acinetobacter pittii]MBN6518313.1 hypothetical protein [Acinetobacter pittii]